ncbi:MAG: hypothetical protein CMB80_12770 [Flammeovirgaceae bacterium]|nr:hypothetical protein [Flammeovirgaceae bacterium]MBE62569.1 hypothetical protein [Flammeovirgaceae bacterium]MBR06067.1 hypothetical protein [Rickettsiales bacterium]HCX23909.1 hypothetical protein [Cytophagales bacterium]
MMEGVNLTEEQKKLIEKLGVNTEKDGMPPAPARVLALLMISPELELTFDQIRETLNLSKSATSNALNMLLSMDRIDYITKSGDRKRYFKNRIKSWREGVTHTFQKLERGADLFEEILNNRPKDTVEFNENLKDIISFMRYSNKRLQTIYEEWEASKE